MAWEDIAENSNPEVTTPNFWDTVDVKPKDVAMALIDCPHCQRRLRVPEDYIGRLTCASCSKEFHRQNEQNEQDQNNLYDSKGRVAVVTNAQRRAGMTPTDVAAKTVVDGGLGILVYTIMFFMFIIYTTSQW
tara:strand:+ start:903 stop:1298 length:396 start_codon:yes stop_codon:yes gene_type:complete